MGTAYTQLFREVLLQRQQRDHAWLGKDIESRGCVLNMGVIPASGWKDRDGD